MEILVKYIQLSTKLSKVYPDLAMCSYKTLYYAYLKVKTVEHLAYESQ